MGYPMTWNRLVHRNGLQGGYDGTGVDDHRMRAVAGDMRRFAHDCRDRQHVSRYADTCGLHPHQVQHLLDLVFEGEPDRAAWLPPPPRVLEAGEPPDFRVPDDDFGN